MSASVLKNALLLLGERDLSGHANTVGLSYGVEPQGATTLDQDTRISKAGLYTAGLSAEGFFDAANDSDLFSKIGVKDELISVANATAQGTVAYAMQAMAGEYVPMEGAAGDLLAFSLNLSATNSLQRGQILLHTSSVTSSGTSSNLNAGSASSQVTAYLHVFSADGTTPTLDVDVESDSADDFTGSETTVISFTQATGRTSERKTASSTADTWWRVNYTLGGTNPDFGFAVILVLE